MRKSLTAAGIVGASLLLAIGISSSAYAADPVYRGCTTTGASGLLRISNWDNPGSTVGIHMEISDTAADGHHVRMRFVSKQTDGKVHYWEWHKNTGGTGTITYNTTASDSR